ncbi:ion transporter [Vibrio sonorensis]|uniref:ion transporter n=1 Tax=Vibrio sonorensis TaxID=1004316 RepID=UPI0008DAA5CE|nr:ion transporter [Vibrio sonorensis]
MDTSLVTNTGQSESLESFGPFQLFTLVLSIYVLVALLVESIFDLSPEVVEVLHIVDTLVCMVFLTDFCIRFKQADNKLQFMKWGWIDLISSIPLLDNFRYSRIVRVIKVLRILRALRSIKIILSYVFEKRMYGTFSLVSIVSILIAIFGAIAVLQFERGVDGSNIHNAHDALWWAFVTITTVGYGDLYPVTYEGRIIAVILMTAGVGLFGTFTGFVSTWFVEDEKSHKGKPLVSELKDEVSELKQEISDLKTLLQKQIN